MEDLDERMAAGEPLLQQALQALQALRRYSEAKGKKPAEEVERLRLDADHSWPRCRNISSGCWAGQCNHFIELAGSGLAPDSSRYPHRG